MRVSFARVHCVSFVLKALGIRRSVGGSDEGSSLEIRDRWICASGGTGGAGVGFGFGFGFGGNALLGQKGTDGTSGEAAGLAVF